MASSEEAAELIGKLGGVQDILSALRDNIDHLAIATEACTAIWSLTVFRKWEFLFFIFFGRRGDRNWRDTLFPAAFLSTPSRPFRHTTAVEPNAQIVSDEQGIEDICSAMQAFLEDANFMAAACSALWCVWEGRRPALPCRRVVCRRSSKGQHNLCPAFSSGHCRLSTKLSTASSTSTASPLSAWPWPSTKTCVRLIKTAALLGAERVGGELSLSCCSRSCHPCCLTCRASTSSRSRCWRSAASSSTVGRENWLALPAVSFLYSACVVHLAFRRCNRELRHVLLRPRRRLGRAQGAGCLASVRTHVQACRRLCVVGACRHAHPFLSH